MRAVREGHRRRVLLATALVGALVVAVGSASGDPPFFQNIPGDQTLEATGPGGASASWTDPTTTDDSPVGCSPGSGSTFPLGTTTVTCSATNVDGTSSVDFHITVQDTQPPVLSVPDSVSAEATGPGGAVVTYSASANDTVDGGVGVSCSPSSGSTFPLGTTGVSCSATDGSGHTGNASFNVTVSDTTPPSISVPGDISTEATGPGGAVVTFSVSASDSVDPSPGVSCNKGSGSTFPVGQTTVSCTATDSSGNSRSGSFTVTITDTGPPSISVPSDISVAATGPGGAAVSYSVSASDTVDPSPDISCSKPSGSTFPVGQTTVTCTATDNSGNSKSGSFKVTVTDSVAPVVNVPGDITEEATGPAGASVSYSASASDNVDGSLTPSCSPGPGTFPIGTTTVTCSAHDSSNNQASKTFKVTVRDTTAPVLTMPADTIQQATSIAGATVTYAVSATDKVDGAVAPSCSKASGAVFPRGVTTVTCTATDAHSNSASASFKVNIVDTLAPSVPSIGTITVEADGPGGAVVDFIRPTAVDLGEPLSTNCSPETGTLFPLGQTTVTCVATDTAGNRGTSTGTVNVVDKTKPTLNVPKPVTVSSSGAASVPRTDTNVATFLAAAQATDIVDGPVAVTNDAPASLPVGTTTITFTAADRSGNVATAQSKITVITGPAAPVTIDTTPPADVKSLKAKPGDRSVLLTWTLPTERDFDHVTITRSARDVEPKTVYSGSKRSFKDTGLANDVTYRYVVVAFDKTGNGSRGLVIRATPKAVLLTSPTNGAVVTKPPVLRWRTAPGATYYNVQLYRIAAVTALAAESASSLKILSVWPTVPQFALPKYWKYGGKPQILSPGRYIWYVWPGLGAKSANHYGGLMGQSVFTVKAVKKPAAKPKPKPKPKKR